MDGETVKRHRHDFFYWKGKERKQGQQCYYDDIKDTQDAQPRPKEDRQGGSASTQKEAAQALTTTAVADEVENRRRARYWMSCAKAGGAGKRIVRSPDRKPKGPKQPKAAYQGQLASSQVVADESSGAGERIVRSPEAAAGRPCNVWSRTLSRRSARKMIAKQWSLTW